jgi:outer membrane protein TolC
MTQFDKKNPGASHRRVARVFSLTKIIPALIIFLGQNASAQQNLKENPKQSLGEKSVTAPRTEVVPIFLDSVLRLSERQNLQVAQAHARVREAGIELDIAARHWLSKVPGSPTYYRKLEAEGKLLRTQAELSRFIYETKVDAAGTYIDLLAALTGLAIAREQEKILEPLLADAHKLAVTEGAARTEVVRIESELAGRRETASRLQTLSAAAAAKLKFLLSTNPQSELQPADRHLIAFDLVKVNRPPQEFLAQALQQGPGIQEMESLVALVDKKHSDEDGHPVDDLTCDLPGAWGIQGILNLKVVSNATEVFTQRQKRQLLQSKGEQARLAYQEVRGRLILGVDEARQTILGSVEQMRQGQEQIVKARRAYELSNERLKLLVPGSSYSEVLLSLQSLALAQANYLNAIREHNKAQVRLVLLLGDRRDLQP